MDPAQFGLVENDVALVDLPLRGPFVPPVGPRVAMGPGGSPLHRPLAHVVLRTGEHAGRGEIIAVPALDGGPSECGDQVLVRGEALVGPSPPDVPGHGQTRGERPAGTGRGRLQRRGPGDAPHEVLVAGGPQADVVREDRGAAHVVVAVHGVGSVQDRDAEPAPA